jgi:hypothetical protein
LPNIGLQALVVLVVLLPGFLCARIVQSLCARKDQSDFDKVTEALVYSFVVYMAYSLVFRSLPVALHIEGKGEAQRYSIEFRGHLLLVLTGLASGIGLLSGYLITNDLLGEWLRKLRLTQRTSRPSVWNDTFAHYGGYAQVGLADGRQIVGWVRYYSDRPEAPSLFLEDAAWVTPDGGYASIDGPGILLTESSGVRHVMFLRPAKAEAASAAAASNRPSN